MCEICREAYHAGYITKGEFWRCPYNPFKLRHNWEAHGAVLRKHPDDPAFAQVGEGLLNYHGLPVSEQIWYVRYFNRNIRRLRNPKRRYLYNATASRSTCEVGARRSLRKPSVGGERHREGESEQLRINEFMRK